MQSQDYSNEISTNLEYRRASVFIAIRSSSFYRNPFTIPELVQREFGTSATLGKGTYAHLCNVIRRDLNLMIIDDDLKYENGHYIYIGA